MMWSRLISRRWFETRQYLLTGLLGVGIMVALLAGARAIFPTLAGSTAAIFLGAFFALAGAPEQILAMRRDRTIVHMLTPRRERHFLLAALAIDAIFSLPFLALAVVAHTAAAQETGFGIADALSLALLAYTLTAPFAWLLSCQAFSASTGSSLTAVGLAIASLCTAALSAASPDSAPFWLAMPWWGWALYAVTAVASVGVSEILLLWWRQGGDLFVA